MLYDSKITTGRLQWPSYTHRSYGWTAGTSYFRKTPVPGYQRPDSFWSEKNDESAQQSEAERKAAKQEKRKRRLATELPQKLAGVLHTILQLDTAIETSEKERKEADDTIETRSIEDGEPFWNTVFERNVKLNNLKKERDNAMHEYRKFYRVLRKVDTKQGEEAREIYRALRKDTIVAKESSQQNSDTEVGANHWDEGHTHQTENQEKDVNEEYNFRSNTPASRVASDDEEQILHSHSTSSNNEPDEEEVILFGMRKLHASHKGVQSEFWSIADGDNVCSYCGITCAVLQCPLWNECGLYACEYCKSSR